MCVSYLWVCVLCVLGNVLVGVGYVGYCGFCCLPAIMEDV